MRLGVGQDVDKEFIKQLARASVFGGRSEFIGSRDHLESRVMHYLKKALQPSVTQLSLELMGITNNNNTTSKSIDKELFTQTPEIIPPLFKGDSRIIYLRIPKTIVDVEEVIVRGVTARGAIEEKIRMEDIVAGKSNNYILHRLFARYSNEILNYY